MQAFTDAAVTAAASARRSGGLRRSARGRTHCDMCPRATRRTAQQQLLCKSPYSNEEEVSEPQALEINLRWRDRVAVFAQICPEKTLESLLEALRANRKSGPKKDDGIEALYTFANFSVWSVTHSFFGRTMDLGQFERFRRVMITKPYDVILNHDSRKVLSALRVNATVYQSRIAFYNDAWKVSDVFHFTLSRTKLGIYDTWMVDSVLCGSNNPLPRYI